MIRRRVRRQTGNAILEFTLVGIPLIFVLISIFEIARGMWIYHTLAYAVTEGTRYTVVRGVNCSSPANSCAASIASIAGVIEYAGVGLMPGQLNLQFTPNSGAPTSCLLPDCLTNTTTWPPSGANLPGMDVVITASYPFSSAIAMFWPGSGPGMGLPTVVVPATARERIQF